MGQKILGLFDQPAAREFKKVLKEEGFAITAEKVRVPQSPTKVQISVTDNDFTRAFELVRKLEIEYMMQAQQRAKAFERNAMVIFLVFVLGFFAYIIISNL